MENAVWPLQFFSNHFSVSNGIVHDHELEEILLANMMIMDQIVDLALDYFIYKISNYPPEYQ